MPANLTPRYYEVEKKLKSATSNDEKILILEEMLSIIPKHKGTEKIQAQLKTKIAKLKHQTQKKGTTARHSSSLVIKKSGAGQVVLIGPPNSGKSQLIKSLTNAEPQISNYPFTTTTPYPAMMHFGDIRIQLVDTPPITIDYMEVWHPEIIKSADTLLLVLDLGSQDSIGEFTTLENRLKEKRLNLVSTLDDDSPLYLMFNKKCLVVANKNDLPQASQQLEQLRQALDSRLPVISVSALQEIGLEHLKAEIFTLLNIIRVYSKAPGKKIEGGEPFTLKCGSTVMDMAKAVHKDFAQKLKFARIWSKQKYQGQKVNRNYILADEDIIELHI